ncbi:short-chain dehydrogenase, partial [Streptomyces sp. NPDC048434]
TGFDSPHTDYRGSGGRPTNQWEPPHGKDGHDYGAHGNFDDRSSARSPLTALARHPAVTSGLLGAALGAASLSRAMHRRRSRC